MSALVRRLLALLLFLTDRLGSRSDRGQSTAEYALVLLGAATVALIFLAWAGRTDAITRLFNAVMDSIIGNVT